MINRGKNMNIYNFATYKVNRTKRTEEVLHRPTILFAGAPLRRDGRRWENHCRHQQNRRTKIYRAKQEIRPTAQGTETGHGVDSL